MQQKNGKKLIALSGLLILISLWLLMPEGNKQAAPQAEYINITETQAFKAWATAPEQDLDIGIELAKARAEHMRVLIKNNPEQAVREALSLSEWNALPSEVQAYVETPFSTVVSIEVLIGCGEETSYTAITTELPDGGTLETYVYGRRNAQSTKVGVPVQGIRIGGIGVLREEIFQRLDAQDEAAALQLYPVAMADPGGPSVASLAGGNIFYFKDDNAFDEANHRIAALEELPGPNSGGQALFDALEEVITEGEIDFQALEILAGDASSEWTGTPRDTYVILVDFPDRLGLPTDPVALSNSINTTVSQQIWEMSYEKTHIVCIVDTNLYTMPLGNAAYTNSSLLFNSATGAVSGVDFSPYETICIFHPAIDGSGYAGLASVGGKRMWLKSSSTKVITHEFGHNYGARHSDTWLPTNNDPADPSGSEIGYGDFTDIMGSGSMPDGHFNVWHKRHINWFDAENWEEIITSGTYRVYRSDHCETTGLLRGLEIQKGGGDQYWIGLRQEQTAYETFSRGAYVLWKFSGDNESDLLDMTPGSADGKYDGGLALGQTYSDTTAAIHITPTDRGGQTPNEWMDITVNLGAFGGNTAPTASISGPTNGAAQESMTFSITASDADGDELAYYWDTGDGLVKPNTPSITTAWLAGSTVTVSCVVSDMKGGTNKVSHAVVLSSPFDTWTQRTSGTTRDIEDITVGNGRLVAVCDDETTLYSDDGTNWSSHQSYNVTAYNIFLEGVTHDGSKFIAVGMDYDFGVGGWEQTIYTSTDGTSWTERYDSNSGSGSNIRMLDVAYGNGIYVAVGENGTIVRSANGTSWSTVTSGTSVDLQAVSYGDGTFVVVGDESSGGSNPHIVLTSTDGTSWTDRSSGTVLPLGNWLFAVEYCNDRFLAGGWSAEILNSINQGESFASTVSGSLNMMAFAYGNGTYFSAGRDVANGNADINMISLDGANWTALSTASQEDRNAAVFFDSTFITVGDNGSIWQSDVVEVLSGGYANWQLENGTELGFNRDPLDDADFDGHLNLEEYARGTSATDAGSNPSETVFETSGSYFQVSYDRNGIKSDINYNVERATDLSSNNWDAATIVIVEDSATNLVVRSALTMTSQTNEFMRLKLQLQ